jgi:phage terminase Nu1 subunit (DNA packaging protein)
MGKRVNKRELSEFLGYSERTLTEWQDAGMPIEEKGDRGEANVYDTADVVKWLVSRETGKDRAETEKERLTRLQADQIELEIAVKRKTLVPVAEIEPVYNRMVATAAAFLRSQIVPLAQSLELVQGEEAKVQLITEGIDGFLTRLSDPHLPDDVELAEEGMEGDRAAPEGKP